MITPTRKSPSRDMDEAEKQFNTDVNRIRYIIEQTIAHLKHWRILHTDYRRPLETFKGTIPTVIALNLYATA